MLDWLLSSVFWWNANTDLADKQSYKHNTPAEPLFWWISLLASPSHPPQPPNDPHGITREELIQMLRDVLAGTPQFAEVRLSALRFSFYFWCNGDVSFLGGLKERLCFATVSVTSHHWEAGLRCSECEAGLAADSGEKSLLIFQNVPARRL